MQLFTTKFAKQRLNERTKTGHQVHVTENDKKISTWHQSLVWFSFRKTNSASLADSQMQSAPHTWPILDRRRLPVGCVVFTCHLDWLVARKYAQVCNRRRGVSASLQVIYHGRRSSLFSAALSTPSRAYAAASCNVVWRANEVNRRRARLVTGWVTVFGRASRDATKPSRPTQPPTLGGMWYE